MPAGDPVVPITGQNAALAFLLGKLGTLQMGLYTNHVDPTIGTQLGDLGEASWQGYKRQPLTGWLPPTGLQPAFTFGNNVVFFNGSPSTVFYYGLFYIDPSDSSLWLVQSLFGLTGQIAPHSSSVPLAPGYALWSYYTD